MRRIFQGGVTLAGLISCVAFQQTTQAAGYRLPESSVNAIALSAAYVANASGPDAAYYNPAAMVFDEGGAALETDLTLVHLRSVDFNGSQFFPPAGGFVPASDSSVVENIAVPTLHYVSPFVGDARFGLSVVTPGGLSKRWEGWGATSAEEFSLKTVEINPTVAYRINDQLGVAVGGRMVYSEGTVRSEIPGSLARDLEGDSFDFGYNLALHYEPNDRLRLSTTYRSNIDLTVEGNARLSNAGMTFYDGDTDVEVPLPAVWAVAAAFDATSDTTVELVVERTYWSAFEDLDFNYATALPPGADVVFDAPRPRDWENSMTYRLGVTHQLNKDWTLMAGFGIDKTPVPETTAGYELPGSDRKLYSFGARYQASPQLAVAGGILYLDGKDLELSASESMSGLDGTFSNIEAILVSVGVTYWFD